MRKGRWHLRRVLHAIVAVAMLIVLPATTASVVSAAPPTLEAHGSVEQVYVTGLTDGEQVALLDSGGSTVATQSANPLGGSLFRDVAPGSGYRVKSVDENTESEPIEVHSDAAAPWDPTVYNQTIASRGYQYLTTRDGTKLAINVSSPAGNGPFPTLIEYSGYGYANPAGPQNGLAIIANLMGFAVVDVNMRGTGCSGGAFDFFEPLQQLDGYDVIETVSKQPWVLNNKVGMFGLSYGGISQLFTAQLNPPSLAAISPLSVLDATATTLYPGGILNTGFALAWGQERVNDAKPAGPSTGQKWAYKQIQGGDTTCAANQDLHGEAIDLIGKIRANSHYVPAVADPLDPVTFVHKIKVPVFMACQWQDEQTGGHCPELVQHMTGTTRKWFTFTNGAHIDSLDPATFNQLYDFLKLYVARQAPIDGKAPVRALAPTIYEQAMGLPAGSKIELPPDPIQDAPTYAEALAMFERLPQVRVRFENGAGTSPSGATTPGNPYATFEASFSTLPVPGTQARTWFLGPDGTLTDQQSATEGIDTYTSDPSALPPTDYTGGTGGGGLWGNASQWKWNWLQNPSGKAASYLTAPLSEDTTVVGKGATYLWVKSSTPNVDLQATISEVRPDGSESFVQNGWIRASQRKLSTGSDNLFKRPSTPVDPIPSFTSADDAPMPADEFVEVAIPLYYQGHAYRAGSKIRVTIAAPGGSQPVWAFAETEPSPGTAQVSLAYTSAMPSSLVLPVVPGVEASADLPVCPSLRNEPCRPYEAFTNSSVILPPTPPTTTTVPTTTIPVTTGPTAAPVTTPATGTPVPTTVRPGSDQDRFLRALYRDLLGRPADAGGLAFWTSRMTAGATRTNVALHLVNSNEFRRLIVLSEYRKLLDRKPTDVELLQGIAMLAKDPSVDDFRAGLIGSDEFWRASGSNAGGFTDSMYERGLGRAPDELSLIYVAGRLADGDSTTAIAAWLVRTPEADLALVRSWYGLYLDRTPSDGESRFWTTRLRSGRTESSIIAELVGSTEYLRSAP